MKNRYATILRSLAQGLDPKTGSPIDSSCLSNTDTVRALFMGAEALEKRSPKKIQPPRAGAPWDSEEDAAVKAKWKKGVDFSDIAAAHQRSRGAILTRLRRMGLIRDK